MRAVIRDQPRQADNPEVIFSGEGVTRMAARSNRFWDFLVRDAGFFVGLLVLSNPAVAQTNLVYQQPPKATCPPPVLWSDIHDF